MTEQQAIQRAVDKGDRDGRRYLVCHRTGDNAYGISGYFVIAKDEKRLYADDETLVFDTGHPAPHLTVDHEDGVIVIRADSITAARLAGRHIFGRVPETQAALQDAIRDSWYAAGCPV